MSRGPIEILKVVEVDGSPQIKLIEESLRYVKETSSDAVESQTIAFLGNTHAGKTTLLNEFTGRNEPTGKEGGPPTTQHIKLYDEPDSEFQSLRYLDCEGFSQAIQYSQTAKNIIKEFAEKRTQLMEKRLPKFIYPIADIIIYVCNGEIARGQFKRIAEFMTGKAVKNVDQWNPPALILVANKVDPMSEFDIEQTTKTFFDAHDAEKNLLSWYHTVRYINIPHKALTMVETNDGNEEYSLEELEVSIENKDPEKIYKDQIDKLKNEMRLILRSMTAKKKKLGITYSSSEWVRLFQFVVHTKENLSIAHTLISLFTKNEDHQKVFEEYNFFWNVLKYQDGAFDCLAKLSIIKYAWLISLNTSVEKPLLARSPDEADQFKKKMEEMFTSFFDQLWELIPCGAVLRHNATKGKTAKCIKTKKGHEDRHCTRIKFYGSIGEDRDKKEGNKLIRFFKDFFSVLHIGYDGRWDGEHYTNIKRSAFKEELLELFHSSYNYFCGNKPPEFFLKVLSFRILLFYFKKIRKTKKLKKYCLICLKPTEKKEFMTLKCGHSFFCEKCIPAYTFIENELWPKVSIPFFKDVLVVPKNNCPICDLKEREKIQIVIPYGTGSISHVGKPKIKNRKLLDLSSQASDFVCELSTTELKIPKKGKDSVLVKMMGREPGKTYKCIVTIVFKEQRTSHTFLFECQDIPMKNLDPAVIEKIKFPNKECIIHESIRSSILRVGKFAIKRFDDKFTLDAEQIKDIEKEMTVLSQLHHKNVDKLIYFHFDPPALVTKYRPLGNLEKFVYNHQLSENQIRQIFRDIITGMNYVHKLNIMHRDLKPENCLIKKENPIRVLVADFGEAKGYLKENMFNTLHKGTLAFMAPEVMKKETYDLSVDVYSFGMTMYFVIAKKLPFLDFKGTGLSDAIQGGLRPDITDSLFNTYRDTIQECWNGDSTRRPTFRELEKEFKMK